MELIECSETSAYWNFNQTPGKYPKEYIHLEILFPAYHKTNVPGLQSYLRGKFASWASNGSFVEEIWKSFKEIIF
jgi:hypothetical protein